MSHTVTLNGNTYTDDDNVETGLDGGGWRLRFIPCLSDMVAQSATNLAAENDQVALAQAAAAAAVATSGATMWVSGTTYNIGNCVWSPMDAAVYRRLTNGAGAVDPSMDTVNWAAIVPDSASSTLYLHSNYGGF